MLLYVAEHCLRLLKLLAVEVLRCCERACQRLDRLSLFFFSLPALSLSLFFSATFLLLMPFCVFNQILKE